MTAAAELGTTPPRAMRRDRWWARAWQDGVEPLLGFAIVIAAWQAGSSLSGVPKVLFPSPADVVWALLDLFNTGILVEYVKLSLLHYLTGVAIGALAGVALGLAIASNRRVSDLLMPLVNFTYAIVEVAWIPLLILWWGYGPSIIIVAVAYVVASPLVHNVVTGVLSVPPVYGRAIRSLGGGSWSVLREVTLPAILPSVFNGVRVGAGFGFRALIFAEMIAQQEGVGYLIFTSAATQQTARTVAGMVVMGVLWLFLDRVYLRPLERASVERWGLTSDAGER
ncbi:ABC transporter permease [Alsobacter metallidurans]|uniref:ABC transporter permease n=1 Tax=Alsobacter metallidurans TaxID=340221 RepID=A0A917I9R3_9HYPH|nr:ABC transporter permease [Alsobacter metallidurans]GGH24188.1 ABC transporter permease [Alsobacter metallidurans]